MGKAGGITGIFMRYIIALLISLNSLYIFYLIFTPLTVLPSYYLLTIFYNAAINGNVIFINNIIILLNEACIAGSAYFLLAVLNLATYGIKPLERLRIFIFDASLLLLFNILRIVMFSYALVSGFAFFDAMHIIVWYGLSILVVVLIWLWTIKLFRIKAIPVLSDFAALRKLLKPERKNLRKGKRRK